MADEETPQAAWSGSFDEDGVPHGQGVMTYPPPPVANEEEEEKPGDTYSGNLNHGKRQGQGKYTWTASNAYYEGSYEDGRKHGTGVMVFPDKGRYEGSWSEDQMHGQGTYTYGSGDVYIGDWVQGKKHGQGTHHVKEQGCQYIGTWADNTFVEGQWVQRDGTIFKGTFNLSLPAQGAFYFSRSGLMQTGCHTAGGAWQGSDVQTAKLELVL